MNEEFYIGWEAKAATRTGTMMRGVVLVLLLLVVLAAFGLAASQRSIGQSVFEWGTTKTFSGILQPEPYPHLLVRRPGKAELLPFSTYYLVAPWKFGLDRGALARLSGKSVTLKGTLIYRGDQTMLETKPEWIQEARTELANQEGRARHSVRADSSAISDMRRARSGAPYQSLGRQTLVGEIVDSKCFLGVMNPGQLIPHRACAVRCISGGIPPVLLVQQKDGRAVYFLLVSADGKPVNKQVLDLVAEPVEISGEVERQGEMLILRADPATYRRMK